MAKPEGINFGFMDFEEMADVFHKTVATIIHMTFFDTVEAAADGFLGNSSGHSSH